MSYSMRTDKRGPGWNTKPSCLSNNHSSSYWYINIYNCLLTISKTLYGIKHQLPNTQLSNGYDRLSINALLQ